MSFNEKIASLYQRIPSLIDRVKTEEATKNAFVLPFITALGYDVFNPQEVIPEFTCDVGIKKGEKVDYAIMQNDEAIILIECKCSGTDLSKVDRSQLYRYFSVTNARIAILTNGVQYRFFSDLDEKHRMDSLPFLELDLRDLRENLIVEVSKLSKENFDLERMLYAANELKYLSEIKKVLDAQLENPEEDFVRFFFMQANPGGHFTKSAKEQFKKLVSKAFQQFISELVSDRLRAALNKEDIASGRKAEDIEEEKIQEESINDEAIVTTDEEIEGYHIIKAIVCQVVNPTRIVYRDAKSYMAILLDDNSRKPICRLWFNRKQKHIGLFDKNKKENRVLIESLSDIYKYIEQLRETVRYYE